MIDVTRLQQLEATEQQFDWCCPIPYVSSFMTCFGCTMTR